MNKNLWAVKILFVFSSLYFLSLSPTQAESFSSDDCATTDLNAAENSPLRSIPLYDQDGTGTCYAHAATTLMNYWLVQHGTKPNDLINPIYTAWVNHYAPLEEQNKTSDLESGYTSDAIIDLKEKGYCKNSQVEDLLNSYKETLNMDDAEVANFLENLYSNYQKATRKGSHPPLSAKSREKLFKETLKKDLYQHDDQECSVNQPIALEQLSSIIGVSSSEALASVFQKCSPKISLTDMPSAIKVSPSGDDGMQKEIDQTLNNKMPIAISMCANIFDHSAYRGLKEQGSNAMPRDSGSNSKANCEVHAVVLTAREEIAGSCKYMIRNSWGPLWHPKNTQCACIEEDGSYETICKKENPKEFVGCWYDSKDLIPNAMSATLLYKP